MPRNRFSAVFLLCLSCIFNAEAQEAKEPWEEYDKLIKTRTTVAALGPTLFGDSVNLANGGLSFSATDVDIPGKFPLPVAVTRSYSAGDRKGALFDMAFGDWDIELPRVSGTYAASTGWVNGRSDIAGQRCSIPDASRALPPTVSLNTVNFQGLEYWHGNQIALPGRGTEELLLVKAGVPLPSSGGPYYWTTQGRTHVSCLVSIRNGTGEGFWAITADGTKYRFDWMASHHQPMLEKTNGSGNRVQLARKLVGIYATRVEDRFGNWVEYSYSNASNAPIRLDSIQSSDERSLSLVYDGYGKVAQISEGARTWQYQYAEGGDANNRRLTTVILPDGSRWSIDFSQLDATIIRYYKGAPGEQWRSCVNNGDLVDVVRTGYISHPSGAVGEFSVSPRRFSRTNVPVQCSQEGTPFDENDDVSWYPLASDVFSLVKKRVTGPGLGTLDWDYSYYDYGGTVVTGPEEEYKSYTFGTGFQSNEGLLLKEEVGSSPANILKTTEYTYELVASGVPYVAQLGTTPQPRSDSFTAEFVRPQKQTVTNQQSTSFTSRVNSFDSFARPLSVTRFSSLGHSRTDVTAYHDNLSSWVLGQTLSVANVDSVPNVVLSQAEYDGVTALPLRYYRPGTSGTSGKLVQTLTYNADGTVAAVKDGNNQVTTLSDWYRGIPRSITYADGSTQSAAVNPSGWITQVTDENGFSTHYTYDPMGRLASVAYPTGDSTVWNTEAFFFTPIQSEEHGLPPGHWTMRRRLGDQHVNTYYDALWRPMLEESLDATDVANTLSQVVKRYDGQGRLSFQSYPQRGVDNYWDTAQGAWTEYDTLGRVTSASQDSEHGLLTTLTRYEIGFKTVVTNPKLQTTTTSYMAYDQPSYDWPKAIEHPENARTDIARDVFGKPTSLTRRDANNTQLVTRHYVYDAYQQLCKTVEPETGATVMDYDNAGNLQWSAAGLSLTSTSSCDTLAGRDSGRKVTRLYDSRDRLEQLLFPDGRGNQVWNYTLDGLPATITTYNSNGGDTVVNSYGYNRRRLLTSESVSQPNVYTWNLAYQYDTNGALAKLTYPSGLQVEFAPNALGQPTRAGAYATGVSYYPNGAIQQFTYGNGLVHAMTQNARQLPLRVQSGNATGYEYAYDRNANPTQIHDLVRGTNYSRTLEYDGLDRLTAAGSVMFGGDHWHRFTYDALDNLRSWKLGGVKDYANYYYESNTNRLLSIQNTAGAAIVGLSYDEQGNLSQKNGQQYAFDFGNRLRQATDKETYRYDGHGRRVQASTPAQAHIRSMYGQDGTLRRQEDHRTGKHYEYITLAGSMVAKVTTVVAPGTPSLTTPSYNVGGSYTVSWTAMATATSYELQEAVNGGSWAAAYTGAGTSRAYTGKGSGNYGYRVRACQASTCGGWSNTGTTTVEMPPASAPSLSVPASAPNGNYTVSWTAVSGASTYTLEESVNGGGWASVQNTASQSKAYSGKAAGSYSYRVKACNPAGCGPTSASATTQAVYPPSGAPALTVPASNYTGSYTVSWTAVAGASSYQLEEQMGGGSWALIHNAAATSVGLSGKPANSYGYRVKACNVVGCGPLTGVATVQVTLPPTAAPSLSAPANVAVDNYTVSWSGVAVATRYQLQERVNGGGWTLIHDAADTSKALGGKANASYGYQARGCNVAGCGPWSAIATTVVNVPPPIPAPPTNFVGEREVSEEPPIQFTYYVSWSGSSGATYYELQVQYTSGGPSIINVGPALSYQNTGGGNRTYWVRACSANGCSAWQGPVSL